MQTENERLIEDIKAMIIETAACVEAITKPSTGKQLWRTIRGWVKTTNKSELLEKLQGYVTQMQNYPLSAEIDEAEIDALWRIVDDLEIAYSVWWRKARETEEEIEEGGDKKINEDRLKVLLKGIKNQLRAINVPKLPAAPVVPAAPVAAQQPAPTAAVVASPFAAVQPKQVTGLQLFGVVPVAPFAAQQPSPPRAPEFTESDDQDEIDLLGADFQDAPVAQDNGEANDNAHFKGFEGPLTTEKSVSQLRATLANIPGLLDDPEEAYEEQDPNFTAPQEHPLPTGDELSQLQGIMANLKTVIDEGAAHAKAPDLEPLIDYSKPEVDRVREEMKLKAARRKNAHSKAAAADNNAATPAAQPQHDAPFAAKMQFFGAKVNAVAPAAKAPAKAPVKAATPAKAADSEAKAPAKTPTLTPQPAADSESPKETPKF